MLVDGLVQYEIDVGLLVVLCFVYGYIVVVVELDLVWVFAFIGSLRDIFCFDVVEYYFVSYFVFIC